MFIIGNFFIALARILSIVLSIMWWLILVRALISWVNPDPFNPIVQFLHKITEPILQPVRRLLPFTGGIDVSPIIVFFLVIFLQAFLVTSLMDIGYRLKQKPGEVRYIQVPIEAGKTTGKEAMFE